MKKHIFLSMLLCSFLPIFASDAGPGPGGKQTKKQQGKYVPLPGTRIEQMLALLTAGDTTPAPKAAPGQSKEVVELVEKIQQGDTARVLKLLPQINTKNRIRIEGMHPYTGHVEVEEMPILEFALRTHTQGIRGYKSHDCQKIILALINKSPFDNFRENLARLAFLPFITPDLVETMLQNGADPVSGYSGKTMLHALQLAYAEMRSPCPQVNEDVKRTRAQLISYMSLRFLNKTPKDVEDLEALIEHVRYFPCAAKLVAWNRKIKAILKESLQEHLQQSKKPTNIVFKYLTGVEHCPVYNCKKVAKLKIPCTECLGTYYCSEDHRLLDQNDHYATFCDFFGKVAPQCTVCKKPCKLKSCSGCNKALYCSADCQRTDWKKHKVDCKKA